MVHEDRCSTVHTPATGAYWAVAMEAHAINAVTRRLVWFPPRTPLIASSGTSPLGVLSLVPDIGFDSRVQQVKVTV
jgi:hypothetical protein